MAGIKGTNTCVPIGGYLLSSQTNSVTLQTTNNNVEATPFEATAKEYITLPPDLNVDINGYLTFDTANGATFENRLHTSITTADTIGLIYYNTAVAGSPGLCIPLLAYTDNMQIQLPVDGVITINGSYSCCWRAPWHLHLLWHGVSNRCDNRNRHWCGGQCWRICVSVCHDADR